MQNKALIVLESLKKEKICSDQDKRGFSKLLSVARTVTAQHIAKLGMIPPGLTASVAITLLKVGLCQELSQRFILEYAINFKEQNINLIFLSNPVSCHTKEDHMLVMIGDAIATDDLFIGRSAAAVSLAESGQLFTEFLTSNKAAVFADPLLDCAGTSEQGLEPLFEYCQKYNLTHIVGIRSFKSIPKFVETAVTVKSNAIQIAGYVEKTIKLTYLECMKIRAQAGGDWDYSAERNYFFFKANNPDQIQKLHLDFQQSGFKPEEIATAEGLRSKTPMFFVKRGRELPLLRLVEAMQPAASTVEVKTI